MPNWVMNRLVIKGRDANKVANKILSKDTDKNKEYMDFNNIDKMPETLNIVCGSCTTPAAEYYLACLNPNQPDITSKYVKKVSEKEFAKIVKDVNKPNKERKIYGENIFGVQARDFDTLGSEKGYINYGKTIVENRINYGHSTWYEWGNAHWGVKWNASDSRVIRDKNKVTIHFETPWDGVSKLICKMAEQYKDLKITIDYDFSEEQVAYYEKHMRFEKGELVDGRFYEEESKEAYEHFMEIWGLEDQFRWDEEEGCYKAKWLDDDDDK